jgi:signal transduction histidine kinase
VDEASCWIGIAVRDTGPGIEPEERERVLERFFRGRLAESGHTAGTGLGLSIVHEIVRAHGGRLTLESEPERGSCFTMWLRCGEHYQGTNAESDDRFSTIPI